MKVVWSFIAAGNLIENNRYIAKENPDIPGAGHLASLGRLFISTMTTDSGAVRVYVVQVMRDRQNARDLWNELGKRLDCKHRGIRTNY